MQSPSYISPTSSDSLQGKYGFKLLAVDVPTAQGAEQRLFLDGDDKLYTRGGVMSELRDPFLRVSTLIKHQINRVLAHTLNSFHATTKDWSMLRSHNSSLNLLQAISMQHTYEAEDEVDEAADDAAEAQEERVRQASQVSSTPEPHDGGLYFSQRVAYRARRLASKFQGQTATEPAESAKPANTWSSRS